MSSPFDEGGRIHLMEIVGTHSLHSVLLWASFKFRPAFKRSSTCFLHVLFNRPLFLRPSILHFKAFFTASLSSFLKTCPNHLTSTCFGHFVYGLIQTQHILSYVFFLSASLAPHIVLSVLLKIPISFSHKHHCSLP